MWTSGHVLVTVTAAAILLPHPIKTLLITADVSEFRLCQEGHAFDQVLQGALEQVAGD